MSSYRDRINELLRCYEVPIKGTVNIPGISGAVLGLVFQDPTASEDVTVALLIVPRDPSLESLVLKLVGEAVQAGELAAESKEPLC